MVSKEEFDKYLANLLNEEQDNSDLEYLTNGAYAKAVLAFSLGAFFTVLGLVMMLLSPLFIFFAIASVFSLIWGIKRLTKINKINKFYEDTYARKVIDYLFQGNKYELDRKKYIDESIFEQSQFGGHFDDYIGEDLLSINIPNDDGSESDTDLILCDLDVEKEEKDRDGNEKTVTVFKGIFGYVDFPFEFNCTLCLNTRYYEKNIPMQKVELEDIQFNKLFRVSCSNQIEARYILTPDMMSKLLSFDEIAKSIEITMVGNRMYVGFSSFRLFEMGTISNGDVASIFRNFYTPIYILLNLINEIRNNNKIFKI